MPQHKFRTSFIVLLLLTQMAFAQDTTRLFSVKNFMQMVLTHHPMAKQNALLSDIAKQEIRYSKGSLDPKFEAEFQQKVYDGKTYFGYIDNGLKVPLWFGSDLKFGYENNTGKQVNPTDFTPPGGLLYGGVHIPIGQGMVIDERRAAVRQAQAMQGLLEAEKVKIINKILFNASKAYWDWYFQYHKLLKIKQSYQLAVARQSAINVRSAMGDLAPIDSVENLLILQERTIALQDVNTDIKNARLSMSNYLWTEDLKPLEMDSTLHPENLLSATFIDNTILKKLLDNAPQIHPDILKLDFKLKQLSIDQKLYKDKLKPNLDFSYKYLTSPRNNFTNDLNLDYVQNNYKVMLSISQPLFLRKERAKYQLAKIKVAQTKLEALQTSREVANTISSSFNEIKFLESSLAMQDNMLNNYTKLLQGEQSKFDNGESSIFMLNARESKLIEAAIKQAEVKSKLEKMKSELYFNAGSLLTDF
jgi:outer membrane protein TolC